MIFVYYEYFDKNLLVYWSNTSFGSLFYEYPYELPVGQQIATYLNQTGSSNASFLGTGYMHAGQIGNFIYSLIVGLMLNILDLLNKKGLKDWIIISVTFSSFVMTITSTDLTTSLITHGLLISYLVLFSIRNLKF